MRIGLVTGEYPPMQGGVGAFTQELAKALHAAGHEIHVITHRDARPGSDDDLGFWERLNRLQEPVDVGYAHLHARANRWRWTDVALIPDIVKRYDLDVLNIQYQAAAYNMRAAAINFVPWRLKGLVPTVITFHDLRVPYLFPKAGSLRRFAVRFMAQQAHGVIVTNPADYQSLNADLQSPIRQIPIGSNIPTHSPDDETVLATRRKLGVRPVDTLLGYFGFLNESKGADTLVRALAQVDAPVHLVFIGGRTGASDTANNQAFLAQLDDLIARLGVEERVHWTGFLPGEGVSAHLHAADLMVLPYRDGVSLRRGTLMAALAHARPVISTTPTTPVPELDHGDNIWLVPPEDPAALAGAIRVLAAAPDTRARLAHGAGRVAEHFTWDKIAARTAAFFAELT